MVRGSRPYSERRPVDQVLLNIIQIAKLYGNDKAYVSRLAASGAFGKPIVAKGTRRKFYRLTAIKKAVGRKFTAQEIEKARTARQHHFPAKRRDTAQALQELTVRVAKAFLRSRDLQWFNGIVKAGVSPTQIETIKSIVCAQIGAMARDFTNPQQEK